ncbi:hypothetical protein GZH47_24345 [Paenibacillus rhizovicinus]|uniref:Uncharacterized protein n=1 Tax=Paenibacillus rhizovicinus TaxID=2704463 RepID=A0A6C0P511_9BACL|nr:hypothetical protein [Paenibacillus rhizovicinus]QHW33618.1 hypothetical protein GZH47_24345 [Paenibacillus rhizovicinus]
MEFDRQELARACQDLIDSIDKTDINDALPAFTRQLGVLGQRYHLTADEVLRNYMEYKSPSNSIGESS